MILPELVIIGLIILVIGIIVWRVFSQKIMNTIGYCLIVIGIIVLIVGLIQMI